jgi:CHASE2 domain-containing sensor protein
MNMPLLIACILAGILVTCVGIYRAYTQGEFMPLVLGMLILMSCAANYLKRHTKEEDGEDQSTDEAANG